jgi:hypothetical protein
MTEYFVFLSFKSTTYSFMYNSEYNLLGNDSKLDQIEPFPNTKEDSRIFDLLETFTQSDDAVAYVLKQHGKPNHVIISKWV